MSYNILWKAVFLNTNHNLFSAHPHKNAAFGCGFICSINNHGYVSVNRTCDCFAQHHLNMEMIKLRKSERRWLEDGG